MNSIVVNIRYEMLKKQRQSKKI